MPNDDFYESVYSNDNPRTPSHGWIQWKGTDVCMDVHCECGRDVHIDAEFFYFFHCTACGRRFAVGQVVKLIPLTGEQAAIAESRNGCWQTGDDTDAE